MPSFQFPILHVQPEPIERAMPAVAQPKLPLPIRVAPALKGQTLSQRIAHRHMEQRLGVDTIGRMPRSQMGVIAQAKNALPEELHSRAQILVGEYAFIGVYWGIRSHFHRSFSAVDEAQHQIVRGDWNKVRAIILAIITNTHRPSK